MNVKPAKRLDQENHRSLMLWAADCAERMLPIFEQKYPLEKRPRQAIEAGRAWTRGEITMSAVRLAAFAAHAAARDSSHIAAREAARAAGHAAATAHVVGHARHAAAYAIKASAAAGMNATVERDWQLHHLSEQLHFIVFPDFAPGKPTE